jgi:hypothetical protein
VSDLPRMAISIRQPWAWAILHAGKDVENRSWHTSFRGPVCLHAAKGMTKAEVHEFDDLVAFNWRIRAPDYDNLPRGGIVGVAEIVDCVKSHPSHWYFGPWAFVLRNARPVDFIPCKGALGFFEWSAERRLL